jgi:hypothetical protein
LWKIIGESLLCEKFGANVRSWSNHVLFHRLRAVTGRAGAPLYLTLSAS